MEQPGDLSQLRRYLLWLPGSFVALPEARFVFFGEALVFCWDKVRNVLVSAVGCFRDTMNLLSHMLHVWNIYQHLP